MYEEKLWQTEDGGFMYLFIYLFFFTEAFCGRKSVIKKFQTYELVFMDSVFWCYRDKLKRKQRN